MLREIRKKMVILRNRSPFPQTVKNHLNSLEYRQWISVNLCLSGTALTPAQIDAILQEDFVREASVEDYLRIERLGELRNYIFRLTDMGASLSTQIIRDMHAILTGGSREEFRKGGIMMESYGRYSTMIGPDIPQAMSEAVYFAGRKEAGENPFEKAAALHNRIIEIYPFRQENETLARAVLCYILAEAGYPLAIPDFSEETYRQMVLDYLNGGGSGPLAHALEQAAADRLDLMMELTGHGI